MVKLVLKNACRWARMDGERWVDSCPNIPIEKAPEPLMVQGAGIHKPGEEGLR